LNYALINAIELLPASAVRIDTGAASSHVDLSGNSWGRDTGFVGGTTVDRGPIAISNTNDAALCKTERYGMQSYGFSVPNGTWLVRLYFCETYWQAPNQRIFDVSANGQTISNLDIFKEAGG